MNRLVFLALTLSGFLAPSSSDALTAKQWLSFAEDSETSAQAIAHGYVMGSLEANILATLTAHQMAECFPQGLDFVQISEMMKKHVRENPADWDRSASVVIFSLVQDRWCSDTAALQ